MGVHAQIMSENFTQVHAAHILVPTEQDAKNLITQINEGADFGELARKYSSCPSGKGADGDFGFFGRGVMVKEFEQAAFETPEGEISEPVKTDFGWHIIKVMNKF